MAIVAYEELEDAELARRAQLERGKWLAELFRRYRRRMYACAHRMLSSTEVEDAVQEIAERILVGLPRFRGDSSLSTWIYSVASHTCLDVRRRRREAAQLPEDFAPTDQTLTPEQAFETSVLACRTALALGDLPETQRQVVLLRLGAGYSTQRTADSLGTTEDAVKARLRRARARLRSDLSDAVVCPQCGPGSYHLESARVAVND